MFVYYYRLFDRYRVQIASLAVLADLDPNWRPGPFRMSLWGCEARFHFPTVKLSDLKPERELSDTKTPNPFAVIAQAHLKAMETRKDPQNRLLWKLTIVKRLYETGFSKKEILDIFHFIDWVMALPKNLEKKFKTQLLKFEEDKQMLYVTSVEKLGIEKGIREALIGILEFRFGNISSDIISELEKIEDVDRLKQVQRFSLESKSIEEFKKK